MGTGPAGLAIHRGNIEEVLMTCVKPPSHHLFGRNCVHMSEEELGLKQLFVFWKAHVAYYVNETEEWCE